MRKQFFLALLAVLLAPLAGYAAEANDVDHPDGYYTTDNSYKHGVKAEPSDTDAEGLNARQSGLYKPHEEQITTTSQVITHSTVPCTYQGKDPKNCTTAVKQQ